MNKKNIYLIIIFLIVISTAAFGRIAGNDFINFDDDVYITENNNIKSGYNQANFKWAFSSVVAGNWHPLTLLSHTLDWSLFEANASGHHIISLFLHVGAAVFLFLFLNKTTNSIWTAAFAAAFFALHPLRVESVAWAAERKDVLSMFFGMACLYAYAFYAENQKLLRYLICLMLFALGLMAKPMLVTLPFVLLLLDYWPLKRWQNVEAITSEKQFRRDGKLVWEKIPFIGLTIASSIVTIWAQNKGGMVASFELLPFLERVNNSIVSYTAYLVKIFWPVNLAVFYPHIYLPLLIILISCIIIVSVTITVIYYIKKIPFLFVGWFWYLGTLIPVIGLIQTGGQAMADRYTYLPSIGISIILAWGIHFVFKSEHIRKKVLFPVAIAILSLLTVLTWKQCSYWENSIALWSHALHVKGDKYIYHDSLGLALFAEGKIEKAINHYNKALLLDPASANTYNNRGTAYSRIGNKKLAIKDYSHAIHLQSDYADAYYNRSSVYIESGQYQNAVQDLTETIRLKPDYIPAYYNRGIAYSKLGQYPLTIKDYSRIIQLKPDHAGAFNNRSAVYLILGNNELGCWDAKKACELGACKVLEIAKSKGDCY